MGRRKNNELVIKAAKLALEKIASQGLYQKAEQESRGEEIKRLNESLTATGAQLDVPKAEQIAPQRAQEEKSKPKIIKDENGKTLAERVGALKEELKVVGELQEELKKLSPTPAQHVEKVAKQDVIDWQATAKVMQSLARIALDMIKEIE